MKSTLSRALADDPTSRWDWLVFVVLACMCYVTFQHSDLSSTVRASLAYLQGHVFDFYEHNMRAGIATAYLPSTYVMFALWSIPLWLLGVLDATDASSSQVLVLMWAKALPTLFYLASAVLVHKIALLAGLGARKARLAAFVWLTTPIAFYSQFIFGQYDSLSVFLVLLGLVAYFRKDLTLFALLFGLAFTFKYFSLFLFLPLLVLAEKRWLAILGKIALFLAPPLLELVLYLPSPAFRAGVFGTSVTSYILTTTISTGYFNIHVFPVAWLLLCAWAYFVEPEYPEASVRWSFYLASISLFLLFGLSMFHPQWLLLATPFWVISTLMNRKTDAFLLLDILMMLFFTAFSVAYHDRDVDQQLFGLGVLKGLATPVLATAKPMRDFFLMTEASLPFSVLSAIMLVNAVFKHPAYWLPRPARQDPSSGLIRARFLLGSAIFVLPATASLIMALNSPPPFFSTARGEFLTIGPLAEGQDVRQVFLPRADTITRIDFLPGMYEGPGESQLIVRLLEPVSDAVLYEHTVDGSDLIDRAYYSLRLPSVRVIPGMRHILVFEALNTTDRDTLTLYRTPSSDLGLSHYAIVDGARQPFDLVVRLYGH